MMNNEDIANEVDIALSVAILDARLEEIAQAKGMTYSAMVRNSIDCFLDSGNGAKPKIRKVQGGVRNDE